MLLLVTECGQVDLTKRERTNVPFSLFSLKVDIMIVSTRIQSLVSEINEKEKENLFFLIKKKKRKKITYIVSSYIFCFLSPSRGTKQIHRPYLSVLFFATLTFFNMYVK